MCDPRPYKCESTTLKRRARAVRHCRWRPRNFIFSQDKSPDLVDLHSLVRSARQAEASKMLHLSVEYIPVTVGYPNSRIPSADPNAG